MTYRPTMLRLADRHCPRAVDFYEAQVPQFRDVFAPGIAAHAILEHIGGLVGEKKAALTDDELQAGTEVITRHLVTVGRVFDDVQEPPLPVSAVLEGRKLALDWLALNPLSPTARYELGVGFDTAWKVVGYKTASARYRLIYDVIDRHVDDQDEDNVQEGVVARDYKSSWATNANELDTVQMKSQALAAFQLIPTLLKSDLLKSDPEFIRTEIVNLRTRAAFARTIYLDEGGLEQLRGWARDLELAMEALDKKDANGHRPARPGHGCEGCPWILACGDAKEFFDGALATIPNARDLVTLGRAYAKSKADTALLGAMMKRATEERPVDIGDAVIGSVPVSAQIPKPNAVAMAFGAWQRLNGTGDLAGFFAHLKVGATALQGIARRLHKRDRAAQLILLDMLFTPIMKPEFGIHEKVEPKPLPDITPEAVDQIIDSPEGWL